MLVDKGHPSSGARWIGPILLVCLAISGIGSAAGVTLSKEQARSIGRRIWQNECNGTIDGLTSWNAGEDFASLGIGHFIWYPAGKRGPFEESFPAFLSFARAQHAALPDWIDTAGACPWDSKAEFDHERQSPKMIALRKFLAGTIDLQTRFLIDRLDHALPRILAESSAEERAHVQREFGRLAASPQGCYALIDYVNFKGEGVLPTERYQGKGWGLLQVLETMRSNETNAVREFGRAAGEMLRQRVANSPPERHESRWLPGWLNRVNSYNRG